MLQKGMSTSSDVRRRQVTRLMSLQDSGRPSSRSKDKKKMSNPTMSLDSDYHSSSIASLIDEEDHEGGANGTPPSLRKKGGSSAIGDLLVR